MGSYSDIIQGNAREVMRRQDELFEELLKEYIIRKLHMSPSMITKPMVGFEILQFPNDNKRQFVSTVTKEVLFEVGVSIPDILGETGHIWWKVYWV